MTLLHPTFADYKSGLVDEWFWFASSTDTTAPTANLGTPTRTKISRVVGRDLTTFDITSDEAFVEYQLRVVPLSSSARNEGTLLEGSTISSTSSFSVDISDDELIAAGGLEGNNVIKAFVKDAAGNWSS
jgi:hypothetical protein